MSALGLAPREVTYCLSKLWPCGLRECQLIETSCTISAATQLIYIHICSVWHGFITTWSKICNSLWMCEDAFMHHVIEDKGWGYKASHWTRNGIYFEKNMLCKCMIYWAASLTFFSWQDGCITDDLLVLHANLCFEHNDIKVCLASCRYFWGR